MKKKLYDRRYHLFTQLALQGTNIVVKGALKPWSEAQNMLRALPCPMCYSLIIKVLIGFLIGFLKVACIRKAKC